MCLLLTLSLSGCEYVDELLLKFKSRPSKEGMVEMIGNEILYAEDLQSATLKASSPEDSAQLAERYIRQWATPILLYNNAKRRVGTDDEIEQMVESYRRSLYVQKYEELLLSQRVSTQLSNDTLLSFYEANSDRFILSENILQGILIVTPKNSPQLKELRKWLKKGIDEIENIERFAYQYASAYQLFTDSWQKVNTIAENTPLDAVDLSKQMVKHNLIETTDSTNIYILSITDKRFAGDSMPFEFAEPEIRNLLLQQRKIDFIKQYEQQTYYNWKNQTK